MSLNVNILSAFIPVELCDTYNNTTYAIFLTTQLWILYCIFDILIYLKWKSCLTTK